MGHEKYKKQLSFEILKEVSLFCDAPQELISYLQNNLRVKSLKAKEALFFQEDKGENFFIISEGAIRIERCSEDGKRLLICVLGKGEVVGEMSLITGNMRMADAIAHEESILYCLEKTTFHDIVSKYPSISSKLMAILSARVLNTSVNLQRLGFSSLQSRLAFILLDLQKRFLCPVNSEKINLKITQSDLADLAVSSREHVNKALKNWKSDGVIEVKRGYIHICKPSVLKLLLPDS